MEEGAGDLDEPYSQLSPLSGVAEQARQSTCWKRVNPIKPGGPVNGLSG
jgi:hypothetical protein